MLIYHGSDVKFDQFDYNFIGKNGTSEGIGFYFSDNKAIAEAYTTGSGYIYTVNFQGKKQLDFNKLTINKTALKKYLLALYNSGIDYLSNYNDVEYFGINKILNEVVNSELESAENDVDLICGIIHGTGDTEKCLQILYKTLGYDSIVTEAEWGKQNIYIALVNDAINIINVENFKQHKNKYKHF